MIQNSKLLVPIPLPPSVHLRAILQNRTHHERAAKQSKYPQSDVDISARASGRCPSRQPLTSAGVTLTGHPKIEREIIMYIQ
jgi:hypothetical protein